MDIVECVAYLAILPGWFGNLHQTGFVKIEPVAKLQFCNSNH